MGLVAYEERERLEELDTLIERWIEVLRDQADMIAQHVDPDQLRRLVDTSKQWAMRLDERLPPSLDPGAVAEIRGIMIGALRKLEEVGEDRPLDIIDDLVVRAESIRHIIRDALDEHLGVDPADARALAGLLVKWLPRVTRRQLAELVGVDVRTFHRWMSQGSEATRRLVLVVRLVTLLKGVWTPEGVVEWFKRPRRELGSRAPIELLDDVSLERALLQSARDGRSEHGS